MTVPRLAVAIGVVCAAAAGCMFDTAGLPGAGVRDAEALDAPSTPPPDGPVPSPADAPPPGPPDATACPVECSTCWLDGTCEIDCGAGECGAGVVCPPGRPCVVVCSGAGACETGLVDCTQATSCDITCSGTDACDAGVRCGGTSCTVVCSGDAACEDGGVDCAADDCAITCYGPNACANHVCCDGTVCGPACAGSAGGCCSCSGC